MLFEQNIWRLYETLPRSERVIADVLLESPGDVAIYTSKELAHRAGSSNSAFSRLIKRIGYKNYKELQHQVRDAQVKGVALYNTTTNPEQSALCEKVEKHLEQDLRNLRTTLEALSYSEFQEAVNRAEKAKKIWVIGFRNGYFYASYLRRHLALLRANITLLPVAGQSIMEDLGEASTDDLVIAIGLRRRSPVLKECMEVLQEMGVPIVYFCDHRAVATRKYADWSFPCQTTGSAVFDSCSAVQSLISFFVNEVQHCIGRNGHHRLLKLEKYVSALSETDVDN